MQRRVELQFGIEAVKSVRLGGDRHVMPGGKLLDVRPCRPGIGEAAGGVARRLQFFCSIEDFRPGFRYLGDAGLLQLILVDPHHHRGRVEGKRQHVSLGGRVVTGDGRKIGLWVERFTRVLHQLIDRLDCAGGTHHRRGADLEHLHDVRGVAGTERSDAGIHGVRIAALIRGYDPVVRLAGVEFVRELVDYIVVAPGHRVPPLQLGHRMRGIGERERGRQRGGKAEVSKWHKFPPVWAVIFVYAR